MAAASSFTNLLKVTLACLLLCPLFLTIANRPFSFVYSYLHCADDLYDWAERLNEQRTNAAVRYFKNGAGETKGAQGVDQRRTSARGETNSKSFQGRRRRQKIHSLGGDSGAARRARALPGTEDCAGDCGIAVGVVTTKRYSPDKQLGYLIQAVAALHFRLRRHRQQGARSSDTNGGVFRTSALYVCNVDYDPGSHSDAAFLKEYVFTVERYGIASSSFSSNASSLLLNVSSMKVPGLEDELTYSTLRHRDRDEKERFDYMFCLQAGARLFRPRYVLLVEDDAVALPEMTSVVEHALRRLTEKAHPVSPRRHCVNGDETKLPSSSLGPCNSVGDRRPPAALFPPIPANREDFSGIVAGGIAYNESVPLHQLNLPIPASGFVYLKLYYHLRWQGYAFEIDPFLDFICVTALLSSAIIGAFRGLETVVAEHIRGRWRRRAAALNNRRILRVVVFSLGVVLLVGRQNVNEIRRLSPHLHRLRPSPSSCTQAVLYPAQTIASAVTWLAHSPDIHVDLALDEFVKRSGLPAYSLEPNLFHHVGKVTSLLKDSEVRAEELLFHEPLNLV